MNDTSVVSEKILLSSELFSVKEQEILLPNGRKKTHKNIFKHSTVSIFPITSDFDVYLIAQYRYGHGRVVLEAPGGYMNKEEIEPVEEAKRELKEETGIIAGTWSPLLSVELGSSVIKGVSHLFLAKDLTFSTPEPEEDEHIEVIKLSLKEAVKKVKKGEISEVLSVAGILLVDKMREEGTL